MSEIETDIGRARAAVDRVGGWGGRDIVIEQAIPVLASPSWRGVDGTPFRARDKASGACLMVKVMHADAVHYIDVGAAFTAATAASVLGVGPAVHLADPEAGTLVMEHLGEGWSTLTLDRLLDPALCDRILAARRTLQQAAPLARTASVFDEIERFWAEVRADGAEIPPYAEWLVRNMAEMKAAFAGKTDAARTIHGDGNCSNVLVNAAGEVRLVDYDRATTSDPLEDLGSFLVEAYAFETEAREAFVRYTGGFDEAAFCRAMLYGVADDLRWALIASLVAARSAREIEFYKFASWRFLRCRMAVRDPRFSERLRRV